MNLLFRIDAVQSKKSSTNPPSTNKTFTFSPLGGVIGRSAECDWVLNDPDRRLSGKHVAISFEDNQYFITDISANGLFINESNTALGKSKAHSIKSGDRFVMGPYALVATIDAVTIESLDVLGEPVHQVSFVEHEHLINTGKDALDDVLEFPQILNSETIASETIASETTDLETTASETSVNNTTIIENRVSEQTEVSKSASVKPVSESPCINFLRGAGLDESLSSHPDINDLMLNFGQLLKSYTHELMTLMGERSRYKNKCRLDMTLVSPDHNNPLKYCVNEAQALREIVIAPQPENLSGGAAVESAMEDIRNHFWRVEQAYQGTLSSMLDYLSVTTSGENQPVEPSSLKPSPVKPWQYRKQIKQLNRKTKLLNDPHFYTEEFLAPRFSYFYQNPNMVQQKEMDNA